MPEQYTARHNIPYPELPDGPPDAPDYYKRISEIVDKFGWIDLGPLSSRPTSTPESPGQATRMYITAGESDSPRLDVDTGTSWFKVGPWPIDGADNVPSLRTLGYGGGQAMPGDAVRTHYSQSTYLIRGSIATSDYIGPFFIGCAPGETKQLTEILFRLRVGTATVKVQHSAFGGALADIGGSGSGIGVTTMDQYVDLTPVAITNRDKIAIVVTAASGDASDLSFTSIFSSAS